MAATGFTFHPTIAFRSGLGPYKRQYFTPISLRSGEQDSLSNISSLTKRVHGNMKFSRH
jgi:hypothetical protein